MQEIQKKSLNNEYKNKDEFVSDLNKLGLSLEEYQGWAKEFQGKILNLDNKDSVFGMMNESFKNYSDAIREMNNRLEALLLALKVDKTISVHENKREQETVFKSGTLGERVHIEQDGTYSVVRKIEEDKNAMVEYYRQFIENILNAQSSMNGVDFYKKPTPVTPNTDVKNVYHFENLVLPNVTDYDTLIKAISSLPIVTK